MAVQETLARNSTLFINTGVALASISASAVVNGASAPTWTPITEITSLNPQISRQQADAGSFDNAGWDDHVVTSRGMTLGLTYKYMLDPADDSRPAGQEALEALVSEIGSDAVGQFKWVILGSNKCRIFEATVDQQGPGGGVNDLGTITSSLIAAGAVYYGAEP